MIFYGKKSLASMIPVYSTTVLYDILKNKKGCKMDRVKKGCEIQGGGQEMTCDGRDNGKNF